MTDGMHHYRQRSQRSAVVKTQHFDALIIRAFRIQADNGSTVDHLATVDVEPDLVFAIANVYRT